MSRETFNLMVALDQGRVETQVALQCAPLLTGLKISNLLVVDSYLAREVPGFFAGTNICCDLLSESRERAVFFVYHKEKLIDYLGKSDVKRLMEHFGYGGCTLMQILSRVAVRYQGHMVNGEGFPHEIGLLLGYPPEDVTGFIENEGRNFLFRGYWKVYANPAECRRIFAAYNWARDKVIRLVSGGMSVKGILACYQ